MKIVELQAENVKHLKVVNIKPDGSVVVIGGDNEAGKSSVLDSIMYALGGQSTIPIKPIRNGQKKAQITLDLGDIEVVRTFTAKGSKLVVKNKDGVTYGSPQAMLDELTGNLTFDPLEFTRLDSKKKLETLKQVLGLDFTDIDAEYKKAFSDRQDINRRGKELKIQFDAIEDNKDVPDAELSVSDMSKQLSKTIACNSLIREAGTKRDREQEELSATLKQIRQLNKKANELADAVKVGELFLEKEKKCDTSKIEAAIQNAEVTNKKVRDKKAKDKLGQELKDLRKKSGELSTKLETINKDKEAQLSKAKFPIKKLSFDEDGVLFDGIPFDQCSTAQQIKVSVAMGLVMNPKLRVLLIREGSLLDEKNLEMIAKMARKADAQIWIERVSKGKECSVIIEDGSVLEEAVTSGKS